jgi:hypothetical protein
MQFVPHRKHRVSITTNPIRLFREIIPVYCGNHKKYKYTLREGGIQRGFVYYNRRQVLLSRCLQGLNINVKYYSLPINSDECTASIFTGKRFWQQVSGEFI